MAATAATGTRGQFPGVGAGGQPRRRNPVNTPRTWRGTRLQASNASVVQLSGLGTTDTNATGLLTVVVPLVGLGSTDTNSTSALGLPASLLPRTLFPGIAPGEPRRRNPVNAPRTFRGTRIASSNAIVVSVGALGTTDSNATGVLTVIYPPTVLPRTLIPGIAPGQPRRRNPVNAPRTFRGTRVSSTPLVIPSEALAGIATTDTNATAILFVASLSLLGVGLTDSSALGALTLAGLVGQGATGSVGVGTLSAAIPEVGISKTGSVGIATLTVGITEALQALASTATQATASLGAAIPLLGAGSTDTAGIGTLSVGGLLSFGSASATGSSATATLGVLQSLGAVALAASSASAGLAVAIPLAGIGIGSDSVATLISVNGQLVSVAATGSLAVGTLLSPVALRGLGTTDTSALSTLAVVTEAAQAIAIVLSDQVAYIVVEMSDA